MSNPYQSSAAEDRVGSADEVSEADLKPSILLTLAGLAVIFFGLFTAATGLQVVLVATIYSFMWVVPYMLVLAGLACMPVGGMVASGRFWASLLSLVVVGGTTFLLFVWVVYSFSGGLIAPLPLMALLAGVPTFLVAAISVPFAQKLSAARARLLA